MKKYEYFQKIMDVFAKTTQVFASLMQVFAKWVRNPCVLRFMCLFLQARIYFGNNAARILVFSRHGAASCAAEARQTT